jgi:hypothetical protein
MSRVEQTAESLLFTEEAQRQEADAALVGAHVCMALFFEDLFTHVLDWAKGDVDYQVGHADMVLTQNLVKLLVIEAKCPGALAWHRKAVHSALEQVSRYADEQKIKRVAISDVICQEHARSEVEAEDHRAADGDECEPSGDPCMARSAQVQESRGR